jgi:hypothetical protein
LKLQNFIFFRFPNFEMDGQTDRDRDNAKWRFLQTCLAGNIRECEKLNEEYVFADDFVLLSRAVSHASSAGNIEMCEWLVNKFRLSDSNIVWEHLDYAFDYAAAYGNIEVARFLYTTFGKKEGVMCNYLYTAFQNEQTNFIKFLFEENMMGKIDIDQMENYGSQICSRRDVDQMLKICEENSPIGSLTKAVGGYYV